MFLGPEKAMLMLVASESTSVFPDEDTDDAPKSTEHWLFCSVPVSPIFAGALQPTPLSLLMARVCVATSNFAPQAWPMLTLLLIKARVDTIADAPAASE